MQRAWDPGRVGRAPTASRSLTTSRCRRTSSRRSATPRRRSWIRKTEPRMPASSRLAELIARRATGHSLQRDFYVDDDVYTADVERIWRTSWLFAGHSCEIREPG